MQESIIDAHAHCGTQDRNPPQSFEDYFNLVRGSGIERVVMFAPVYEIYDRFDPFFEDTPYWQERRKQANQYLLNIGNSELPVIPYFFIWNDFAIQDLSTEFQGIKWHRHSDEPEYDYDSPGCREAVKEIKRRNLPVVLEEEFVNTKRFIREIASGVRVIIPHLGALNGGYRRIAQEGLFQLPNVYADTSLAGRQEILDYLEKFGTERLMFGSDFPFGHPVREMQKIIDLPVDEQTKEGLLSGNLKKLLAESLT